MYKKVLDTFVNDVDEKPTEDRFVRLEDDEFDFKVCIVFYKSGLIDLKASPAFSQGGRAPMNDPCIFYKHWPKDGSSGPRFEAYIPSARLITAQMPAYLQSVQRLQKNMEAINDVALAVEHGERFL